MSSTTEAAPPPSTHKSPSLIELYTLMLTIRYFEERVSTLKAAGHIAGSVHLCQGQEAVCAGACAALALPSDLVFPTYRGHGWAVAAGVPLYPLFAELMGRADGTNGGRAGSANLSYPEAGLMPENAIVGASAAIATGAAVASRLRGDKRTVLISLGDGALNQGSVHEAINFASIRNAPVIFLIENNKYSELTLTERMVRDPNLYRRARGYGINGVRIDGKDPMAVYATIQHCATSAREGDNGPFFVEAITDRLVGHYVGDVQHYRTRLDIEKANETDPVVCVANALLEQNCDLGLLTAREDQVRGKVEAAAVAALAAPPADPTTVLEHLYREF